jgi:dTDP-4-amino-4,6-dideoxygalactose transaminase
VARFSAVKAAVLKGLKRFVEITPQVQNDPEGEVGYLLRFYPDTIERGERIVAALGERKIKASTRGRQGGHDWHCYSYMYPLSGQCAFKRGDCPVADDLFDRVINIPLNQWYTPADCRAVAERINDALATCCTIAPNGRA